MSELPNEHELLLLGGAEHLAGYVANVVASRGEARAAIDAAHFAATVGALATTVAGAVPSPPTYPAMADFVDIRPQRC